MTSINPIQLAKMAVFESKSAAAHAASTQRFLRLGWNADETTFYYISALKAGVVGVDGALYLTPEKLSKKRSNAKVHKDMENFCDGQGQLTDLGKAWALANLHFLEGLPVAKPPPEEVEEEGDDTLKAAPEGAAPDAAAAGAAAFEAAVPLPVPAPNVANLEQQPPPPPPPPPPPSALAHLQDMETGFDEHSDEHSDEHAAGYAAGHTAGYALGHAEATCAEAQRILDLEAQVQNLRGRISELEEDLGELQKYNLFSASSPSSPTAAMKGKSEGHGGGEGDGGGGGGLGGGEGGGEGGGGGGGRLGAGEGGGVDSDGGGRKSDGGGGKGATSTSTGRTLKDWYPVFACRPGTTEPVVMIEGNLVEAGKDGARLWRSREVLMTLPSKGSLTSYRLECGGTIYTLQGQMKQHGADHRTGFCNVYKDFRQGWPPNWMALIIAASTTATQVTGTDDDVEVVDVQSKPNVNPAAAAAGASRAGTTKEGELRAGSKAGSAATAATAEAARLAARAGAGLPGMCGFPGCPLPEKHSGIHLQSSEMAAMLGRSRRPTTGATEHMLPPGRASAASPPIQNLKRKLQPPAPTLWDKRSVDPDQDATCCSCRATDRQGQELFRCWAHYTDGCLSFTCERCSDRALNAAGIRPSLENVETYTCPKHSTLS